VVGVTLAKSKRYRFDPKSHTAVNNLNGTITFNQSRLDPLSDETKCAVVAHELWHSKLQGKTKRRERFMLFLLVLTAGGIGALALVVSVVLAAGFLVGDSVLEYDRTVVLATLIISGVAEFGLFPLIRRRLRRRYIWPIELECDEAAVRFFGIGPTRVYLTTPGVISEDSDHPPREVRISNAEAAAKRYPVPAIDFPSLQAEIPRRYI